jgi:hypothetical protein
MVLGILLGSVRQAAGEAPVGAAAFWQSRQLAAATAAQVVGLRDLLGSAAMLRGSYGMAMWEGLAPGIDPDLLAPVEDEKPLPTLRRKGPDDKDIVGNQDEFYAYCRVVAQAARTSEQAFANSARENKWITFGHLIREPREYRGKVVHVEGRLKRLRREPAPEPVKKEGIPFLYEGWVFGETVGSNPLCVLFTELPPGLKEGEDLNDKVAFNGYFFKKYLYQAADQKWRYAPLLIGRTVSVVKEPAAPSPTAHLPSVMVASILAMVVFMVALVVGLSWWFRRGDRRTQARLAEAKAAPFFDDEAPAGPSPSPDAAVSPEPFPPGLDLPGRERESRPPHSRDIWHHGN